MLVENGANINQIDLCGESILSVYLTNVKPANPIIVRYFIK